MNPEALFLGELFRSLDLRGVNYAVMRNSETLPQSLGGSDLDLLVDGQTGVEEIVRISDDVAMRLGGKCVSRYKTEAMVLCYGGRHSNGGQWGLHIDIFPGFSYFGIPYFDAATALSGRVRERDSFYRLTGLSNVASLLKELLFNGRTKKNYYQEARDYYQDCPNEVESVLTHCYGKVGWKEIFSMLKKELGKDDLRVISKKIRKRLLLFYLNRHGVVKTAWVRMANLLQRLKRVLVPPGFCVAFLGTDGSGKSTLIESITEPIERMLHSKVHYEHLRPNMLPSLARLAGKPQKDGPTTDPHGGKVAGRISSLVRFAYYYVDYVVGYWLKIFPILVKRPSMVFFDRYYYEYMIDPRRCAVRLPRGWARFWSWFIPKPDLILCLGGNPEKIYARKPETSLEEVRRQVAELKNFCERNKRAVWIDTTTNIESSRDAAIMAITEKMAARYK